MKVYSERYWKKPVYSHLVQREQVCEHDSTNTMQSGLYTLAGCFMTQFNSDCIYLEEHQAPQAKSSEARLLSTPNAPGHPTHQLSVRFNTTLLKEINLLG